MKELVLNGIYKHYKGNLYKAVCVAKDSETLDELVVYQSLQDDCFWVRPRKMFLETVMIDGKKVERFALAMKYKQGGD